MQHTVAMTIQQWEQQGEVNREQLDLQDVRRCRLTVLVPLADNKGVPFTPQQFACFEQYARDLAGGITSGGERQGQWFHNGLWYRDASREYILIVPCKAAARIAQALAAYVRGMFRQLAVYIELSIVRVVGF